MKKKLLAGIALSAAAVLGIAGPAHAASDLITINPSGGTGANDGLKIDVAYGQIQVTRNGEQQLYGGDVDPTSPSAISNYITVVFDMGSGVYRYVGGDQVSASGNVNVDWTSFDSSSNLDGNSGSVVNTLHSDGDGDPSLAVDVEYTVSYTYPHSYLNLGVNVVSVGSALAGKPYKIYWYTDAMLSGGDAGHQFGGVTAGGSVLGGVVTPTNSDLQAFRQTSGQHLNWYAGHYECPFSDFTGSETQCSTDANTGGAGNWVALYQDFPNHFGTDGNESVDTSLDNGWGASSPEFTTVNNPINFDMIFASCIEGSDVLACAAAAGGETPAPALATTGSNATDIAATVVALMLVGAAAVVIAARRRTV